MYIEYLLAHILHIKAPHSTCNTKSRTENTYMSITLKERRVLYNTIN